MYIAIFDSQPQGEAHGLQSNRFLKLPSFPLAESLYGPELFSRAVVKVWTESRPVGPYRLGGSKVSE
jgi:hypothetical protein